MRPTKSATSSSLKAFCSDSIGTAWRTLANPRDGAAPTLRDRLSSVRRFGNFAARWRHSACRSASYSASDTLGASFW